MRDDELAVVASQQWADLKVYGKSFVYNQLVNKNAGRTQTVNGVTITNNGDGSWTLNGTATANVFFFINTTTGKGGHKIFWGYVNLSQAIDGLQLLDGGGTLTTSLPKIDNWTNTGTVAIDIFVRNGTTLNNVRVVPIFIDLTDLFGAGNEPTTLEEFYQTEVGKQVKNGVYLPYAPTNTKYDSHTPFNFYKDNELVASYSRTARLDLGNQSFSDATDEGVATVYLSIDQMIKDYGFNTAFNGYCNGYSIVSMDRLSNKEDVDCVIAFFGSTLQIKDLRIKNLKAADVKQFLSGKVLDYEPAEQSFVLRQGDTFTNTNGKNNVVMGEVDLGSLNWVYNTQFIIFTASFPSAKPTTSGSILANILCSKYKTNGFTTIRDNLSNDKQVGLNTASTLGIRDTNYTSSADFKQAMSGVKLTYELATPQTKEVPSMMIPRKPDKCFDANGVELDFEVRNGIYAKYNQLVPNSFVRLSSSTSVVPSANKMGSYITVFDPSLVGHRVYAKIITSNPKIRVAWYKDGTNGYDFATGQVINASSDVPTANEGVYTITQDMVHGGTGFLQFYYFVYAGLTTGSHSITVQLIDLTKLEMQNIIALPIFKATKLGAIVNKGVVFDCTKGENKIYDY